MNCVGVTCLRTVIPSPRGASWPLYLAETDFQVPMSLLSALVPPFGSSARPEAATSTSAVATANNRDAIVDMVILRVVSPPHRTKVALDGDWDSTVAKPGGERN